MQRVIEHFGTSTEANFSAKFDPIMKLILVFAIIYDRTSRKHRHKLVEYFNSNLEYPDQIRDYMSKFANVLEYLFKSANVSSRKFVADNTISNIQSYGERNTPKTIKPTFQDQTSRGGRSKSLSRPSIDLQTTPKCFQCERYCHRTLECAFYPFYSSCKDFHQRGTLQRMKNITSNRGNSQWFNNSRKPTERPNPRPNLPNN